MENADLLDYYYTKLYNEYNRSEWQKMRNTIIGIRIYFPNFRTEVDRKVFNKLSQDPFSSISFKDISEVNIPSLKENAKEYMVVMHEELQKKYTQTFSENALQKLYDSTDFSQTNILYEKNGNILTVDKLISVMGYAIKTIEALSPNERTEELSKALTVFKSIDLLLTNHLQDKPLNKFLHIANDVLASFVKKSVATDKAKQKNGCNSLLIDLAIDFFCNR